MSAPSRGQAARGSRRASIVAAGFTLLEVMIAIAILGLIGGLTFKSFDEAYDLKSRIERAQERDRMMRMALSRMARELSMAYLSEHYDKKRYRTRPTIFRVKDGRQDADVLFTAFAHERLYTDAKEADEAAFGYTLDPAEDGSGRTDLFRREKAIIDEDIEREGSRSTLAEGVLRFSVECWDPKDREWREEWDSNSTSRLGQVLLPPRIRIGLTFKDENGQEKTLSTQTQVLLGQPLDF